MKSLVFAIGAPDPSEPEALATYGKETGQLLRQVGGKGVARYMIAETLHGDDPAAFVAIMEFPSSEAAKGFFDSEAYRNVIPARDRAFRSLSIYLAQPGQTLETVD